MKKRKNIILLGSTGSIGMSAFKIAERYPDRFRIIALACGQNANAIAPQIRKFKPLLVSVRDDETREKLKAHLAEEKTLPTILTGEEGLMEVASAEGGDLLVNGLVGFIGVKPTVLALQRGLDVALANKETLVIGGSLIMDIAREHKASVIPIDSEHSAIFQCLLGVKPPYREKIKRIILTASGGPFRDRTDDFYNATPDEVLKHPNWDMGAKVTVDSATLMNKGLEIIEAKVLFGLDDDQIDVVVHRQSIVHSLVEFQDGSVLAQLGYPSMEIPIQFAMSYPDRMPSTLKPLDLVELGKLTFEKPDVERFPCLKIAQDALKSGGLKTAALNGADEGAVKLFLDGKIPFGRIPEIIKNVIESLDTRFDINIDNALEVNRQAMLRTGLLS